MSATREWNLLNPDPYGGISYFERGTRKTLVGTPRAYARTWVVGYGAGRGQSVMLDQPPRVVETFRGLPIYYADVFGFYVGDYPGEFDTLVEAEAHARMLAEAEEPPRGPLPLLALLGLLLVV